MKRVIVIGPNAVTEIVFCFTLAISNYDKSGSLSVDKLLFYAEA